jgi:hypothetical protein
MIKVLQKHNFFSQKYVCWADFDKNLFENLPMKPQKIQTDTKHQVIAIACMAYVHY